MEKKDILGMGIGLSVSIAAFAAGLYVRSLEKNLDKVGIRTMGKIVSNDAGSVMSPDVGITWYKGVEFATKEGKTVVIQSRVGWVPGKKLIGTAVPVIYDPADPQGGEIDTFMERKMAWLIPTITGGLILLTLAVYFSILYL